MRKPHMIVALCAVLTPTAMLAQQAHTHSTMTHQQGHTAPMAEVSLNEPGQGAFAAISEIVASLSADPTTDWSKVDIGALRAHLVDMDLLITHAKVTETALEDGIEMRMALEGPGGGAAGRMVPMHGPILAMETGWNSELAREDGALVWRVTGWSAQDAQMIHALGFFGLMATGDHHRAHHMGLATGAGMH